MECPDHSRTTVQCPACWKSGISSEKNTHPQEVTMPRYTTVYNQRPPFPPTRYGQQVIIMQDQPRPDPHMKNLYILCPANGSHPLPVQKVRIGVPRHHKYGWQYIYACPICNHREAWITGYDGRPFRLWRGYSDNR